MKNKLTYAFAFLVAIAFGVGILALYSDIANKKVESRNYPLMLNKVSELEPSFEKWGQNFPAQLDTFKQMELENPEIPNSGKYFSTEFGGTLPFSKIIRYPAATVFWNGYAFGVDYSKPRTHFYSQIDQIETKRNSKEYLNSHGLPAFKGQTGACVNCHTGHLTALMLDSDYKLSQNPSPAASRPMPFFDVKENGDTMKAAWTKMNALPYKDVMAKITEKHGTDPHAGGSHMGMSCADCHHPDDMSLRITRPAMVNAMVDRGYQADAKQGIKATRQEMRSMVCMQCHVEYYFDKESVVTYPWKHWKKGEPFKIEFFDKYYDEELAKDGFKFDYIHKDTGAKIIKMQHSEAELHSTSIHARSGVSCADCHMPYKRNGSEKITDHNMISPLANVNASCKTCHMQGENELKARVSFIQNRFAHELRKCENSLLSLIQDIKTARSELVKHEKFANLGEKEQKDAITKALDSVLALHRKAHIRWDFAYSENSYGFHGDEEANRVVGQCKEISRQGQLELANTLSDFGIKIKFTQIADEIEPPKEIGHKYPTGVAPTKAMKETDEKVKNLDFK
ncbi:MAG: ammonia-forming cytochrome c nitrite reductase subunit c552 [Campylobacter sp.]|nr:ammonia-forming cytochrome c nitrite reductase subunit c552 [Campylobacter sp.]